LGRKLPILFPFFSDVHCRAKGTDSFSFVNSSPLSSGTRGGTLRHKFLFTRPTFSLKATNFSKDLPELRLEGSVNAEAGQGTAPKLSEDQQI
jgi:hypothetical protein